MEMSGPQKIISNIKSKLKPATCVLIGLNFVLVVALFSVSMKHRSESQKQINCSTEVETEKMNDSHKGYCFRATERVCLDRGYELKKKMKKNETVCCGNLNEHVYSLMSEEIGEKLRRDAAKGWVMKRVKSFIIHLQQDPSATKERPAAHVGILHSGNLTGPDSKVPDIRWEQSGEQSFLTGGVIHGGDRLIVTKPGFYYVYTGLQFTIDPQDEPRGAVVAFLYQ